MINNKSFRVLSLIFICLIVNQVIYSQSIGLVNVRNAEQVITVGGSGADIPGFTSAAIQIALDAISTRVFSVSLVRSVCQKIHH
jgi:hypothetical protein